MPLLTDTDEQLRAWLAGVVGDDVPVRAGPPRDVVPQEVVEPELTAYLFEVASGRRVNGDVHRPPPTVVRLGYLVCADAPQLQQALQVLDAVLVAALDPPEDMRGLEIDLAPVPPERWAALSARPRPALTLRMAAHHQRQVEQGPVVRTPLRVVASGSQPLAGRVIGHGDQPLAGAEVAVEAIAATTRTSDDGSFLFPLVPTGGLRLVVRAKGRSFVVDADPAGEPLLIHCDPLEA